MNYVILTILVIVLSVIYDKTKSYKSAAFRNVWLCLICFVLCVFAGLRSSYNDTKTYIAIFESTATNLKNVFPGGFAIGNEYLNGLHKWFVYNFISKDYHVYFFICSAFFVVPAIFVMEKYSVDFSFSMLLFMTTGLYLFSLAAVRQSIAIGILILGLDAFNKGKHGKFVILCLAATSFHLYSIIMLSLLLLKGRKIFGFKMNLVCILVLMAGVGMTQFSELFSEVTAMMGQDITSEEIGEGSVSIFRALVYVAPLALTFMTKRRLNKKNFKEQNTFVVVSVLSGMFMILALFGNPILLGRVPYYFLFGTVITIPYIIQSAFTKSSIVPMKWLVAACYSGYELYQLNLDGAFVRDIFGIIWFT